MAISACFGLTLLRLEGAGTALLPLVYDNGVQASQVTNGRVNDPDFSIPLEHADNFSIATTGQISSVTWHGLYETNIPSFQVDDFSLSLFSTTSGVINPTPLLDTPLVLSEKFDTGFNVGGSLNLFSYTASFSSFSLAPGDYAISIFNNVENGVEWFWGVSNFTSDGSYQTDVSTLEWNPINPGAPEFSFALF